MPLVALSARQVSWRILDYQPDFYLHAGRLPGTGRIKNFCGYYQFSSNNQ
jgi:hypothetical protein